MVHSRKLNLLFGIFLILLCHTLLAQESISDDSDYWYEEEIKPKEEGDIFSLPDDDENIQNGTIVRHYYHKNFYTRICKYDIKDIFFWENCDFDLYSKKKPSLLYIYQSPDRKINVGRMVIDKHINLKFIRRDVNIYTGKKDCWMYIENNGISGWIDITDTQGENDFFLSDEYVLIEKKYMCNAEVFTYYVFPISYRLHVSGNVALFERPDGGKICGFISANGLDTNDIDEEKNEDELFEEYKTSKDSSELFRSDYYINARYIWYKKDEYGRADDSYYIVYDEFGQHEEGWTNVRQYDDYKYPQDIYWYLTWLFNGI